MSKLIDLLVNDLNAAVSDDDFRSITFAYPEIVDSMRNCFFRYMGFRSKATFIDLLIEDYVHELRKARISVTRETLKTHKIRETDDDHESNGKDISVFDCLAFETNIDSIKYVLAAGRWYCIDSSLAEETEQFFRNTLKTSMPCPLPYFQCGETEESYYRRIINELGDNVLGMHKSTIVPPGASTGIEVCDFLLKSGGFVHVKAKTASRELSHLFNQGVVPLKALVDSTKCRERYRDHVVQREKEYSRNGFSSKIDVTQMSAANVNVIYCVIKETSREIIPFFSLVTFQHIYTELNRMGAKPHFCWITSQRTNGMS